MSSVCAEGRPHSRRSFLDSALAIVRSILMLVLIWRARSRVRRQLAVMSERELHDIGICRAEIADETAKPFWREIKGRLS